MGIHTKILDGPVFLAIRLGADAAHADVLIEVGAADAAVAAPVHAADALVVDRQLAAVGDGVAARQLDAEPVARARRVADVAPAREVVVRHDGPVVVAVVVQPADAALGHGGLGSHGHGRGDGGEDECDQDGGHGCGKGGGECGCRRSHGERAIGSFFFWLADWKDWILRITRR
ncbi:hypothetical protein PGQ11_009351 [Apiospora arundinis]|uniref:Uncharacterized protein n=1 Tax=Apiospora arundinis TaxID=335852 RepID=A0ABR2IHS0_9PEZI